MVYEDDDITLSRFRATYLDIKKMKTYIKT